MKTKFSRVLLAFILVCSLLAGCSKANGEKDSKTNGTTEDVVTTDETKDLDTEELKVPEYLNETGFPIVKEPITLTAMVLVSPAQPFDWNEILVWEEYEKMTGIHIEWEAYTNAEIVEKRNLALASGEMPDLFFRTKMPDSDISKYGADGSFLELSQLIEQYAPNYKKITEIYPDVASGIPMADGFIYALPNLTDSPSIEVTKKLFLNQKWLEATGNTTPTTTEELYNILVDFRDKDPNGNGIADEIPLTADMLDDIILTIRGSFGLGNRGAFLISSECKYPEAAMRWIDYFYSEEGSKMMFLGVEGISYQQNEDGSYDFLDEIVNNIPEGSSFDQVVSKYVPYAGGALPTIIYEEFFKGGETQPIPKVASANMAPFLPNNLWAPFSFTAEESERMVALETDISSMVKQRTAEFVQGKVSLDEFDSYVEQLNKMGLEELKAIYTEAYTRYLKQ